MTQPQPLDLDAIEAAARNAARIGSGIDPATTTVLAAEIRRLRAELAAVTEQRDYWHHEVRCADARIAELGRRKPPAAARP